jgi:flavorubredoxin
MKSHSIYQEKHQWIYFGRDPEKPHKIIDSNQFLIINNQQGLLLDPGGVELFAPMLSSVVKFIPLEQITQLFASHQDPDIISSLGLWDQVIPDAKLHGPWLWESFIRHFGMNNIEYLPIPDEGRTLDLGGLSLQLIPAHYLHSSGNFNVYDPISKILFSGDIGAALEPADSPLFVDNFEEHIPKMKLFHQRWMPSNDAKQDWINRVRKLDIDMMLPQHGRMFKGENVGKFLDWFEQLQVGSAISRK